MVAILGHRHGTAVPVIESFAYEHDPRIRA